VSTGPSCGGTGPGAAFGAHVLADLQSEAPAVVVECDGAIDLAAAERWAELVDVVVMIVDADSEIGNDRAAHYVRHIREPAPGAKSLAIPLMRVDTAPELVDAYLSSYRYNFRGSVPAARDGEGIWGVALPDVRHTVGFAPLPLEEPPELRASYSRLAAIVQHALADPNEMALLPGNGHSGRAEAFADARRRVRWDVFIASQVTTRRARWRFGSICGDITCARSWRRRTCRGRSAPTRGEPQSSARWSAARSSWCWSAQRRWRHQRSGI